MENLLERALLAARSGRLWLEGIHVSSAFGAKKNHLNSTSIKQTL